VKTEFSRTVRITKNRTVRHSNSTARSAMIMCQSRPLEPSRTVRVLLADRPQFRHSEHSERQRLWTNLKFEGRTVRTPWADRPPFTSCNPPEVKSSLDNFSTDLRTVRTPGADHPQYGLQAQTELQSLWRKKELYLRTVRLTGPDRPPVTSFSHKLININSNTFSFANVPATPSEQHHVHVC